MKKYALVVFAALLSLGALAQTDKNLLSNKRDRLVTTLSWNHLTNVDDSIPQKWYGRGLNLSYMFDRPLGKSGFSFAPGVGLTFNNYYHGGVFSESDTSAYMNFTPLNFNSDTLISELNYEDDVKNNKLNTVYVDIPLELRYMTKPDDKNKSFKIAVGARAGLLLGSHTKYRGPGDSFGSFKSGEDLAKNKEFKLLGLRQIRYGATFRIGYGNLNLSTYYGISSLFEDAQGPEMMPIEVGISFTSF